MQVKEKLQVRKKKKDAGSNIDIEEDFGIKVSNKVESDVKDSDKEKSDACFSGSDKHFLTDFSDSDKESVMDGSESFVMFVSDSDKDIITESYDSDGSFVHLNLLNESVPDKQEGSEIQDSVSVADSSDSETGESKEDWIKACYYSDKESIDDDPDRPSVYERFGPYSAHRYETFSNSESSRNLYLDEKYRKKSSLYQRSKGDSDADSNSSGNATANDDCRVVCGFTSSTVDPAAKLEMWRRDREHMKAIRLMQAIKLRHFEENHLRRKEVFDALESDDESSTAVVELNMDHLNVSRNCKHDDFLNEILREEKIVEEKKYLEEIKKFHEKKEMLLEREMSHKLKETLKFNSTSSYTDSSEEYSSIDSSEEDIENARGSPKRIDLLHLEMDRNLNRRSEEVLLSKDETMFQLKRVELGMNTVMKQEIERSEAESHVLNGQLLEKSWLTNSEDEQKSWVTNSEDEQSIPEIEYSEEDILLQERMIRELEKNTIIREEAVPEGVFTFGDDDFPFEPVKTRSLNLHKRRNESSVNPKARQGFNLNEDSLNENNASLRAKIKELREVNINKFESGNPKARQGFNLYQDYMDESPRTKMEKLFEVKGKKFEFSSDSSSESSSSDTDSDGIIDEIIENKNARYNISNNEGIKKMPKKYERCLDNGTETRKGNNFTEQPEWEDKETAEFMNTIRIIRSKLIRFQEEVESIKPRGVLTEERALYVLNFIHNSFKLLKDLSRELLMASDKMEDHIAKVAREQAVRSENLSKIVFLIGMKENPEFKELFKVINRNLDKNASN